VVVQTVWSVKGGAGVTVVATSIAVGAARREGRAVLVDLCGDAPAVLGMPEPSGPGVRDWLASGRSGSDALQRLVVPVAEGLSLLPCGSPTVDPWPPTRSEELAEALVALGARVVIDAGRCGGPSFGTTHDDLVATLGRRGRSYLVTRPCYVALRRAVSMGIAADGVVLVDEPGRCLGRHDVADVLSLPVLATVDLDPALARSVDAGLLARRPHRMLERSLRELW
jgi:Mrp family chromosome partitioning ATPase